MKIALIIQARMGSHRLPGKSMMELCGEPLVYRIIERIKRCSRLDEIILAIPDQSLDDDLANLGAKAKVNVFRGSENNVLDRFYKAASFAEADFVLRFPADNFAPEPSEIDRLIEFHISENPEGFSTNLTNVFDSGYPDGIGAEMFNFYNLEKAWKNPSTENQKEHVHLNFFDYSSESIVDKKNCPVKTISCPIEFRRPDLVLDVNEKCQFTYARSLYEALYPINNNFTILDIIEWHDNVYSQK